MIKFIRLLICLALLTICNLVYAQSYTIKSDEGTPVKVKLFHRTDSSQLSISILTDSLLIGDVDKVVNVEVFNGRFLKIVWNGAKFHNKTTVSGTIILSLSKMKIDVSTMFCSLADRDYHKMGDLPAMKGHYAVTATLTGTDENNYKLLVDIIDQKSSTPHSANDHNRNLHAILTFDPIQNIFFGSCKNIDREFMIAGLAKQRIKKLLPTIILGSATYYFYNGSWYILSGDELRKEY